MSELAGILARLDERDLELLDRIRRGMPITADLSRSDLLLLCPRNEQEVVVVSQAQPHSIASIYSTGLTHQILTRSDAPVVLSAWQRRRHVRAQREVLPSGAPVVQDVYPIRGHGGEVVALLSIETSLIQLERHRQRHPSFRRAIEWVKWMCLHGDLAEAEGLSPFGEWDGVMLVDAQRRITYLSGIANNLYRRLGCLEDLRGKRLSALGTSDDEMVLVAFESRRPLEREVRESSYTWVRKVLPIWAPPTLPNRLRRLVDRHPRPGEIAGALIMVHDATAERQKRQELEIKTTMIQEVHHRVKNNLQTIAATLRMQVRRTQDPAVADALSEAVGRILSVAVIHEFLSLKESQTINIRDVSQRIVGQNRGIMVPGKQISFSVEGPAIYLPSQQATSCALVVNELVQNALKHGFGGRDQGHIRILLTDGGDQVRLEIRDNGTPLPADFDLDKSNSMGLQIVRTLVEGDLRGTVRMENQGDEVVAAVSFPKITVAEE